MTQEQFIKNYKYLHLSYEVIDGHVKLINTPREMQDALENMPELEKRMILAWKKNNPNPQSTYQAVKAETEEPEAPVPVKEKVMPEQPCINQKLENVIPVVKGSFGAECTLRNFVMVIAGSYTLSKGFFIEEALEVINRDNRYILTQQKAKEYLDYLVSKNYFTVQEHRYKQVVFSYAMDFWKEPGVEYKYL